MEDGVFVPQIEVEEETLFFDKDDPLFVISYAGKASTVSGIRGRCGK